VTGTTTHTGRLVLDDRVTPGRIVVAGDRIVSVEADSTVPDGLPYLAPGFVDVHVHGGGGHDAIAGSGALDGLARSLLRHGVTSFLPTAVSAPIARLATFADDVRGWLRTAPDDAAAPLGFNLEGPFLAAERRGAHDPSALRVPADVEPVDLEPLIDGLRLITIAPELPGALELIRSLVGRGVAVSLGHSAATLDEARAGYAAGATGTTHLFNAMSGVHHHRPGLAVAALTDDAVHVELIADGEHVDRSLWPIIARAKPEGRVVLVSDALALAGLGDGRTSLGGLAVEVVGQRATLLGTATLAGSVIALDAAVRNLVASGLSLPFAVAAASRNPLGLLGVSDRGRLAPGQLADLVELDADLRVRRVMHSGTWFEGIAG
jgi:N-acetylglucosamine-6-phosphate deacetylase